MKQYIVSMYVRSRSSSPSEITRLMGATPSGYHEKGSLTSQGTACFLDHLWRLDSDAGDEATIEAHLDSLLAKMAGTFPIDGNLESGGLSILLGVGVMYDTYTTSVFLPRSVVRFAGGLGASIEVSTYPTEFDEDSS